jgi:hypothetical protein
MIKVIILSQPADAPAIAHAAGIDAEDALLPDGNLSLVGLRRIHARLTDNMSAIRYTQVATCRSVDRLIEIVETLFNELGPIDLLEIVGHGAEGLQKIGDEVLFAADRTHLTTGDATVDRLRGCLAANGRLRLLGCMTGCGETGRMMLGALGLRFGIEQTVYGTIERVNPSDFETGEFSQVQELLFSSESAVDHTAPDATSRTRNLQSLARASRVAA